VRWLKTTAVVIPRSQPMTAAARMTQTIEACVDPNTQLSFTLAVFLEIKTIRTASSATKSTAQV
jgi:hypothetical protein